MVIKSGWMLLMTGGSRMSVMRALACEIYMSSLCQVMVYGVKFVPSIIRGPYKLARISLDVTND